MVEKRMRRACFVPHVQFVDRVPGIFDPAFQLISLIRRAGGTQIGAIIVHVQIGAGLNGVG